MAYPNVNLINSTNYIVEGEIAYASAFCKNDSYTITPFTQTNLSRGVCLITGISAKVRTPDGDFVATPYESSGTSYSQFAVIQTGLKSFMVTRRVARLDIEPAEPVQIAEPVEHPILINQERSHRIELTPFPTIEPVKRPGSTRPK